MKAKDTQELLRELGRAKGKDQLEKVLEGAEGSRLPGSFPEYYRQREGVKACRTADLIRRSGLDPSYFYQIMRGSKKPGRSKVLCLALAGRLTLQETRRALRLADCADLSPRIRRDMVLVYCLEKQYDADRTDMILAMMGEECLRAL